MEENTLIKRFPLVTVLITVINVAAFFITEWKGSTLDPDFMIEAGGMYAPAFFGEHEYYRLITHFFLHFGIEHLFFNMVSLVMFGHVIESCSAANEINRLVWDIGHISDACFMDNNERISKSKTEAIKAHLDLTIRYLEKSETKHTVKSLVSTIYNDIYQVVLVQS